MAASGSTMSVRCALGAGYVALLLGCASLTGVQTAVAPQTFVRVATPSLGVSRMPLHSSDLAPQLLDRSAPASRRAKAVANAHLPAVAPVQVLSTTPGPRAHVPMPAAHLIADAGPTVYSVRRLPNRGGRVIFRTQALLPPPLELVTPVADPIGLTPAATEQERGQIAAAISDEISVPASVTTAVDRGSAPGPATTPVSTRSAVSRVGDTVEVMLDGAGWIYGGGAGGGVRLVDRELAAGNTSFRFVTDEIGDYRLQFSKQDNLRGTAQQQLVSLSVVADEGYDRFVADRSLAGGERGGEELLRQADLLVELGRDDEAVIEYIKAFDSLAGQSQPDIAISAATLNDRLAATYDRLGEADAAAKHWRLNIDADGGEGAAAVIGLVRMAMGQDDLPALVELLPSFFAAAPAAPEELFLDIADRFVNMGGATVALRILDAYGGIHPRGGAAGEAGFLRGRALEIDSDSRDLAAAMRAYARVALEYPETRSAGDAAERHRYLRRHFFLVQ